MLDDVPVSAMIRHLEHMLTILGEDGVSLGSDFDGAVVPQLVGDASCLGILRQAMIDHGFGKALVKKICYQNWMGLLKKTWAR